MFLRRLKSLSAQAFACAVVAATILAIVYATAPNATRSAVSITLVFAHELGHLIGAAATDHRWIELGIGRDSGHVITQGSSDRIALVLMGPLFPAILASLALTLAAIQRWNSVLLVGFGLCALLTVMLSGPYDSAVNWTLYAIAGLGALSLAPIWRWMRAILTFFLGMVLSIGVLNSMRRFGLESPDPDQVSDAMQLAQQLAPADPASALGDVRAIVLGLIALIYLTTAIIAANLLLSQERKPA